MKQLQFRSQGEWMQVQKDICDDDHAWLEFQAYAFAGCILVPSDALKIMYTDARQAVEARHPGRSQDFYRSIAEQHLADEFAVSTGVIQRRIDKDGL